MSDYYESSDYESSDYYESEEDYHESEDYYGDGGDSYGYSNNNYKGYYESEDYYGGGGDSYGYSNNNYKGESVKSEYYYGGGGGYKGKSQSSRPYIVYEGRNPGVYDKWEDCNRQVSGYSGAYFRKAPASEYNGGRSQAPKDPSAPYIVFEGRNPGLYNKWDDAKDQVSGYPGATYRRGSSSDEAKRDFIEYSKKY